MSGTVNTRRWHYISLAVLILLNVLLLGRTVFAEERNTLPDLPDLIERVSDSIVKVWAVQLVDVNPPSSLPDNKDAPFAEEFDDFLKKKRPDGKYRKAINIGSGFVIDRTGIVVTASHIVEDGEEILVSLDAKTTLTAKIVGRDEKTDVAVLRIKSPRPLKAIAVGDSQKVRFGDRVLAIGFPFSYGKAATTGVVSAKKTGHQQWTL